MQKARQFFPLNLHVAHVDHGLRESSHTEAHYLQSNIALPFHTTRLQAPPNSNIEDWAREERYTYFRSVIKAIDGQALVVAHHLNDQAETVFKRVLEGANLTKLSGLQSVSHRFGMTVWRPLLGIAKKRSSN